MISVEFYGIMETIIKIIGGFTIIFNGLYELSKLTKTEKDDNFFRKGINILTKLSGWLSLNRTK